MTGEPAKRKQGGQTRYTVACGLRICERIADGASLQKAAEAEGLRHSTVLGWTKQHPAFADKYARACGARLNMLEDKLLVLCSMAHEAALDNECGTNRIQAIKLEIDTLKWLLSKLLPRRFGDKVVEDAGGEAQAGLSAEQVAEIVARIAVQQANIQNKLENQYKEDT